MEKGTYRSSLIKTLFWVLLISLIPEFACFAMIAAPNAGNQRTIAILFAAVVIPFLSILCTLYFWITIRVSDRDVQFFRFGRSFRTIPFEKNTISAYVQRYTINFIIPLSYRNLRVTDSVGLTKDYLCYGFSKKNFDALMYEIEARSDHYRSITGNRQEPDPGRFDPVRPSFENDASGAYDSPYGVASFTFPRDLLRKMLIKNLIGNAIASVFLILIFAFGIGVTVLEGVPWTDELMYALSAPAGILLIIIIAVIALQWIIFRKRSNRIPEKIQITDNALRIDDRTFSLGEIRMVKMTPANYLVYNTYNVRTYRKLRIETADKPADYILGHIGNMRGCFCYPEYEALHKAINGLMQKAGKNVVSYTF